MILINQNIPESQTLYGLAAAFKRLVWCLTWLRQNTLARRGGKPERHAALAAPWTWLFLLLGLAIPQPADARNSTNVEAGPLWHEFPLTLAPGWRQEFLGPIFSFQKSETEKEWALHPLFSLTRDPVTDVSEFDLVYPIFSSDRFGRESRIQFFQLLSFSSGQNQDEQQTRRFTLFPFYFQQRSDDPSKNYTALLPIYGTLKNRLLRDEIHVVLFPLYVQSRKRDVVTSNYLFPIFHWRRGNKLQGWQVWPLVGHEEKELTSRTNRFDVVEVTGGHEKWFVLWPFFFNQRTELGTDDPVWQQAVIPLYSIYRSKKRDSSTYLWPIFTYTEDREKKYREWGAPWPLISLARGEGKSITRLWPLFGHASNTNLTSKFYLWPVYKFNRLHSEPLDRTRMRIMFFLYSDVTEKNLDTGDHKRRKDFWPFFTYHRGFGGEKRWQALSIIEPLVPNNKSIERNYSPLWSLWRYEENPKNGTVSQSLLWNLWRRDRRPESTKQSFFFGLVRSEKTAAGKKWRLFYLPPFGKGTKSTAQEKGAELKDPDGSGSAPLGKEKPGQ